MPTPLISQMTAAPKASDSVDGQAVDKRRPDRLVVVEGEAEAGRGAMGLLRAERVVLTRDDALDEAPVLHEDRVVQVQFA